MIIYLWFLFQFDRAETIYLIKCEKKKKKKQTDDDSKPNEINEDCNCKRAVESETRAHLWCIQFCVRAKSIYVCIIIIQFHHKY